MAEWKHGDESAARKWYETAVAWMARNDPTNEELSRFRAEAAELLGLPLPDQPAERKPGGGTDASTTNS
jgi:hypothetical protein